MPILRYAGFAEENEFAQETPPEVQFHVDKTSSSLDTPSDVQMIYGGGLRRNAMTHRPGFYAPTGNVAYATDINTMVYFLKWALGGYGFSKDFSRKTVIEESTKVKVEGGAYEMTEGEFSHVPTPGTKIVVSGFLEEANNGTMNVKSATETRIEVEEDLTDESEGEEVTIEAQKNLHELYGVDYVILDSFCARLGKDHFEHIFSGCVIDSLQLEVEGEFAVMTVNIIASKDSKGDVKESDYLLPKPYLLAFHNVTVSVTDKNTGEFIEPNQVKSFSLEINNNADSATGRALGKRHPVRIVTGERTVTADMSLFYKDTKAVEQFWGNADGPAKTGTKEFSIEVAVDSEPYGNATIKLPRCIFTNVDTQPSGRDELAQSVSTRAFVDDQELSTEEEKLTDVLVEVENYMDEVGE